MLRPSSALAAALAAALALAACASAPGEPGAPGRVASDGVAGWVPSVLADGDAAFLPDYSYAGYRWGDEPIPTPTAASGATVIRAADHGVEPDDGRDDTAGLRAAVAAADGVEGWAVVELPAGTVELRNLLFVERGRFVLRGAGSGAGGTVLSMPVPMADMDQPPLMERLNAYLIANDKKVKSGEYFTPYSWTGGILWTRAPEGTAPASNASIAGDLSGTRGTHTFTAELPNALRVGETVRLGWFNRDGPDSPVLQHLYGMADGLDGDRLWEKPDEPLVTQEVTVTAIDGATVTVHEPLLHDLRPEWSSALAPETRLEHVGIEGMRIVFPDVPYAGHHLEPGFNAIYLTDLRDGWVRDVTFVNADSGILSDHCANLTLADIRVHGRVGHYGVHIGKVERVLLTDFETTGWMEHPVSFNTGARQSVITRGRIVSPQLDQHRGANHTNLFDDLETAEPTDNLRLFGHGGAGYWGPTHGVANTFWNVRFAIARPDTVTAPLVLDGVKAAGAAHVVGLTANVPVEIDYPGAQVEGTNRPGIAVPSLYRHQLARRRAAR